MTRRPLTGHDLRLWLDHAPAPRRPPAPLLDPDFDRDDDNHYWREQPAPKTVDECYAALMNC